MKWLLILLLAPVLICSCSLYSSDYPVGTADSAASYDKLIGDWVITECPLDSDLVQHHIRVMPFNDNEILIELLPGNDTCLHSDDLKKGIRLFRCWVSKVNKKNFINLTVLKNRKREPRYVVGQINVSKDKATVQTISKERLGQIDMEINSVEDHQKLAKYLIKNPDEFDVHMKLERLKVKR